MKLVWMKKNAVKLVPKIVRRIKMENFVIIVRSSIKTISKYESLGLTHNAAPVLVR